jgi:predicted Zn-dependent peptidase
MAKVPATYLRRALAVLSDMILHPAFRPADIEKEREVILEEIRMYEDTPAQYVHDVFNQLVWPNHPLGNLLCGTIETVRRIMRPELVTYWRTLYHPRNCLMACAGALDPKQVIHHMEKVFVRAPHGSPRRFAAAPTPQRGPQVRLLHKTTEQTHVCLGTPAIPRTHPQRFALELLHVLLGANMSSRLFHEVREKRGLVYEIGTQIKRYKDTGAFVIYAGCDPGKLSTTLQTILHELSRLKRELVQPQELRRAKAFYRGQLLMGLEDTLEQMLWMGEQAVTVGQVTRVQDLLVRLSRVTSQQIREVARRIFTPRRLYLAAIGPVSDHRAATLHILGRL